MAGSNIFVPRRLQKDNGYDEKNITRQVANALALVTEVSALVAERRNANHDVARLNGHGHGKKATLD